jgi:NAD(P)-dependent dehydrogenase (short-subunit alcohol dehydrogenase family)
MTHERSVLVTGAAHRLGAEIATAFARAGWQVLCHYERSREAAEALVSSLAAQGLRAAAVQGSLDSEAACLALFQQALAHTDRLHCVVNNASTFVPDQGADFRSDQALHQLQVNLLAPLVLGRELARQAQGDASVIHILDQKVFNLNPDYFSYTVSKLALERAVALQAQSLSPALRVCGVAPGLMYLSGPQTRDNFNRAASANLLRRPTDPLDVARTCLFLASTASITGTVLSVDNGQHLVPLPRDIMFVVDDLLKGITP